MRHIRSAAAATTLLVIALAACRELADAPAAGPSARADGAAPGVHRQYGTPQKLGRGTVRTYVVLDEKGGRAPLEVGVAMSRDAMEGLPPAPVATTAAHEQGHGHHGHESMFVYLLDLPAQNPTPYQFVQFDWNPKGHEPAGVYDTAHFDFHFYTVPVSVRNSIVPSDPQYAAKAASLPGPQLRPPFYVDAASPFGAPAAAVTVPLMGLHWVDVRSPELQRVAGNPAGWAPFTKTYFLGSWDGRFIFDEPMITLDYLLTKSDSLTAPAARDEIIPVPTAARHETPGYYPGAYRITYDERAKEYRVALTQLAWRE